jgi:hypothetical protein
MTLELSSDELRTLMHTVSLALYVTEPSQDPECAAEMEAMQALADKIFDAGWRAGHQDIAQFDAGQGLFMLREEYVNDSVYSRTIRDFEDDFFWGELAHALAERDLRTRKGAKPLDPVEHNDRLQDLEDHYLDLFTDHGVNHLHAIHPEPNQ